MTNVKLKDAMIASYSGGTDSLFEITLSCPRENVDAVLNELGGLEVEIKSKDASKQEYPQVIDHICSRAEIPVPYMDGDQWCVLKGDNIQVGVVGFGDTKEDALVDFIKNIPLQQEQSEVDFEEEWDRFEDWTESYNQSDYPTCYEPKQIARHFFELVLNARKEKNI